MAEPDAVEEGWARVEEAWDDDAAHRRFISLCATLGRLDEAGGRYRAIRDARDDPRADAAKKRIDQLFAVAMRSLEAHRTPPPEKRNTKLLFFAIGLFVVIVGTSLWAFARGG